MIPHDNSDVTNDDIFKMLAGELTPSDIHRRREEEEQARLQALVKDELIEFYQPLNTRHLLKEYKNWRPYNCGWDYEPSKVYPFVLHVKHGVEKVFVSSVGVKPSEQTIVAALKEVLDTREHVPRGKKARQLRAKQRKGQGKSKNR